MPQVILENFKFGLDTRRSALTSVLGTLSTLQNAYINQGGEVAKRKSFVGIDLPIDIPTYGIEALKDSLVIFGGDDDTGITWPTGVTYQRLYRDLNNDVADICPVGGGSNPPNFCSLCVDYLPPDKCIGVVYSTVFDGKAFVIAQMGDATTGVANGLFCAFYDGEPVRDLYLGEVLPGMTTNLQLYCMLAQAINLTGVYTADLNDATDPTGVIVTGPTGTSYTVTVDGSGTLCTGIATGLSSLGTQTISGHISAGGFQILDGVASGSSNRIDQIVVGATNLLASAVNFITDVPTTAAAVVTAINANTNVSGYNATNNGGGIIIYANTTGTATNGLAISVTVTGKVIIGQCGLAFSGTGFTLNYINANGVNILSTTLTFPTASETLSAFCGRVQDNINAGTGSHGYVAFARDNIVKISKKTTSSSDGEITVNVRVTPGSGSVGQVVDGGATVLTVYTSLTSMVIDVHYRAVIKSQAAFVSANSQQPISAIVTGGKAPYSYAWRVTDNEGLYPVTANGPTTNFSAKNLTSLVGLLDPTKKHGTIYLDVVDSAGTKVTAIAVPILYNAVLES